MSLTETLIRAGRAAALAVFSLALLVAQGGWGDPGAAAGVGTPAAGATSDAATPADPAGCGQLPAYFAAANALVAGNEGLAILNGAGYDVLALTADEAPAVVASLDALLAAWDRLAPPPAAEGWHEATRDLYAWYRDMAADRDHLDHQRLINGDKTIVPALGRATMAGQQACGYERWNEALTTSPATPAP